MGLAIIVKGHCNSARCQSLLQGDFLSPSLVLFQLELSVCTFLSNFGRVPSPPQQTNLKSQIQHASTVWEVLVQKVDVPYVLQHLLAMAYFPREIFYS